MIVGNREGRLSECLRPSTIIWEGASRPRVDQRERHRLRARQSARDHPKRAL